MQSHIIRAIVKRELSSYFSSPTGYVFITIFVFLSAVAAFWLPGFFDRNLATLDQLNTWFPVLLLFIVPAVAMGSWAEERKTGTDELLLTLPARDRELVLGKYLACLSIYSVSLVFSLSHLAVLWYLGRPDLGVVASTYLGYFLAGAALIAVGLVGSAVTGNLTLAFIVSALLCGLVVSLGGLAGLMPGTVWERAATALSFRERFEDFGRGVVSLENIGYFVGIAAIGLWANTFIVNRRHWAGSTSGGTRTGLAFVRGAAFIVIAGAGVVLLSRLGARADATQERLWSLSPETKKQVMALSADRPVLVTAYVSNDVPVGFVQTRDTLLGLLREMQATSGGRVVTRVVEAEAFTDAAREAQRTFGITPQQVPPAPEDPEPRVREVFMGVAFTCGPEQFVIPFMNKGLPVEYELARSINRVSLAGRKKVGVLETEAQLFGEFNYQTFTPGRDWPIVEELRKQYEVTRVSKGQPVPAEVDLLVVAQASTLANEELTHMVDYVKAGRAALIFEDPLALVNPALSTGEPRGSMNAFQRQPNQAPKADLTPLYAALGISSPKDKIVWDSYNPRPQFADIPREFVFVGKGSGTPDAFGSTDPITSGLQEVALMCTGVVEQAAQAPAGLVFTPLLKSSPVTGLVDYSQMLQRTPFGVAGLNPTRRPMKSAGQHVLAARISAPAGTGEGASKGLNAVFVADLDCVSDLFFNLRAQGAADLQFDNVTFVLNAVDTLAGDQSLLELRKRRPVHRTLERLDLARADQQKSQLAAINAANDKADSELEKAKANLQTKVDEINKRTDMDESTKRIMSESVREAEQRRLDVQTAAINDAKQAEILEARMKAKEEIDRTQMSIRAAAVALPPIPALLLAGVVLANRRRMESAGVAKERLR
ncbi:MAG: Gldg family protein [Planctomycetes bacterium]|nr:Gldg family protein [Planctomycetota bacterium]